MSHPIAHRPEIAAALEQLLSQGEWCVYEGEACQHLRRRLSEIFRREHVYLACSGTLAVELALRGCGVGPDDLVLIAGYDFPGNLVAIQRIGARPLVVDVLPGSWQIDVDAAAAAADAHRPAAIVVSHLHGQLAPIDSLERLSQELKIPLVEDVCQMPGAAWHGRPAGAWGAVSVLSFGGSKLLTAGRGGAVMCNDPRIMQRILSDVTRGNDAYALSQLQAAVLLPQLDLLPEMHRQRAAGTQQILDAIHEIGGLHSPVTIAPPEIDPAFYKLGLLIDGNIAQRDSWLAAMTAAGLAAGEGFRAVATKTRRPAVRWGDLSQAADVSQRTILLDHRVLHDAGPAAAALRQTAAIHYAGDRGLPE